MAPFVRSQDMRGMIEEITVDPGRPSALVAVQDLDQIEPVASHRMVSGARFWKSRMSTTTSMPASRRMALPGNRTAPRKLAIPPI
jgi:hypothetical protein